MDAEIVSGVAMRMIVAANCRLIRGDYWAEKKFIKVACFVVFVSETAAKNLIVKSF